MAALLAWLSMMPAGAGAAADPVSRCAAQRMRVVLRTVVAEGACHIRALRRPQPPLAACIDGAHTALQRALARLDDEACEHDVDAQALEALTDSYIAQVAALVIPPGPTPTPGPSPGPTPTSRGPSDCGAASSWTCCLVDQIDPPIPCFEAMAGPDGSASDTTFTQTCQSAQGIMVPGHCPPQFCSGGPTACCSTGACNTDDVLGTTAYFGPLAPSAGEFLCPSDTFTAGACPGT